MTNNIILLHDKQKNKEHDWNENIFGYYMLQYVLFVYMK